MTHNIIHDEKENLWVEVMDDYVRTAELGLYALEQKRHKEEMRGHFEKLWNWHIKSLIKHIDSEIERLENIIPPYPADKENPLKHAYQNQGYMQATQDTVKSLKAQLTKSK